MTNYKIPEQVIEECSEVIQAVIKVQRFGLEQKHPKSGKTNKESLEYEIGNLYRVLSSLISEWNLSNSSIDAGWLEKNGNLSKYSKYHVNSPFEVNGDGNPNNV